MAKKNYKPMTARRLVLLGGLIKDLINQTQDHLDQMYPNKPTDQSLLDMDDPQLDWVQELGLLRATHILVLKRFKLTALIEALNRKIKDKKQSAPTRRKPTKSRHS